MVLMKYFGADGILAQNDKVLLRLQTEEDKENYIALFKENSLVANAVGDEQGKEFCEFTWEKNKEENAIYISVFDPSGKEYLGNLIIRYPDKEMPELGLDILRKYQRRRFGYNSVKLLCKTLSKEIEYFLVRVYSDNVASNALVRLLGAEEIGNEVNEFEAIITRMKSALGDAIAELPGLSKEEEKAMFDKNYIIQYRLKL